MAAIIVKTRRLLAANLLLAVACMLAGDLGRVLPEPAGFATALWLPSGIAVSAVLMYGPLALPAVVLGVGVVNLTFRGAYALAPSTLLLAALIGLGAAMQAFAGAQLARRMLKQEVSGAMMARVLLVAGPLACLVGATWGNAFLWLTGRIDAAAIPLDWLTWWIGNALGVGLVLPIYAAYTLGPAESRWRRTINVALPVALALCVSLVLFERSLSFERQSVSARARSRVENATKTLRMGVQRYADVLYSLRGYFLAGPPVDEASFDALARSLLPRYPGLQALEWAPIAGDPQAGPEQLVVPVRFVEPRAGNEPAVGFDLASESLRREALLAALRTGKATATKPLTLVQERQNDPGFLLFLPVARDGRAAGFVVGVFRIPDMLTGVLVPTLGDDLALDVLARDSGELLFQYRPQRASANAPELVRQTQVPAIDGLAWTFVFHPTAAFIPAQAYLQSWAALAGSLLFTAFLGVFLTILSSRNETLRESQWNLAHARDAAEAASRAKSTFLANMSHELRTPLAAVIGYSELLSDPGLAPTERERFADATLRNGRQLTRLIDDILDLSKIEAGHMAIERAEFALAPFLSELEETFAIRVRQRQQTLEIRAAGALPGTITSDRLRLRQILDNIIGNAIKFTPPRGRVTVTVEAGEPAQDRDEITAAFTVKDTGLGIARDQWDRLFQSFSQADSSMSRTFGGTGLGLALSRRLARALGGDVVLAESVLGKGSAFRVTVKAGPRAAAPAGTGAPAAAGAAPGQASLPPLAGVRVLVADDAPDNRFLIQRSLRGSGAEVEAVGDGREAIRAASERPFDLVIMDIQMPHVDGYEATREIRRNGFAGPIIALTAHALKEERDRCLAVGCDEHLTKPVNYEHLVDVIAGWVAQRDPGRRG